MSSADTDTVEETPEAAPVDEARAEVVAKLTAELGEAVLGSHIRVGDDIWVRVSRDAWRESGVVVQASATAVIVRPDFHVFGAVGSTDEVPGLVDELNRQLMTHQEAIHG